MQNDVPSGPKTGKRLAGAAALSLVTLATATGVLATAPAASASETAPTATVSSPFLKTELSSLSTLLGGGFHKIESGSFLKLT